MDYISHIVSFLSGCGVGWAFTISIQKVNNANRKYSVTQKNNIALGDIVAGDVNKQKEG